MIRRLRLWWRRRTVDRRFRPLIGRARAERNHEKARDLLREYSTERELIEEEWHWLYQRKLIRRARRLFIPIPVGDAWEESPVSGDRFLTGSATKALRQQIREELKARREMLVAWVAPLATVLGSLIGLVGSLTGLAAVIGSK